MSVAYEHRAFPIDSPYAPVGEQHHHHHHHHNVATNTDAATADDADDDDDDTDMNKYINTEANVDDMADLAAATYEPRAHSPSPFHTSPDSPAATLDHLVGGPPSNNAVVIVDPAHVPLTTTPTHGPVATRSKPIAKPSRVVTKNDAGMFECRWSECNEDIKVFPRKCEWSKHMDKHERPYVCTVRGCEKVQGFTYSGGLLRHEREVHGKHGGPKKAFNCPHENCKRSSGKGFSRMENLQEHLRRVHTGATAAAATTTTTTTPGSDPCAEVANAAFAAMTTTPTTTNTAAAVAANREGASSPGQEMAAVGYACKRKRGGELEDEGRAEARLRRRLVVLEEEKDELRHELAEVKRQNVDMRAQLERFQAQVEAFQAAISQLAVAVPPPPSSSVL